MAGYGSILTLSLTFSPACGGGSISLVSFFGEPDEESFGSTAATACGLAGTTVGMTAILANTVVWWEGNGYHC